MYSKWRKTTSRKHPSSDPSSTHHTFINECKIQISLTSVNNNYYFQIRRLEKAEKANWKVSQPVQFTGGRWGMWRHVVCVEAQAVDPTYRGSRPAKSTERCDDATFPSLRLHTIIILYFVLLIVCAVFWRDSDVTTYHSSRRSSNDRATVRVRRRDHGQCTVTHLQVTSHSNPVAYDNANVAPVRVHFVRCC